MSGFHLATGEGQPKPVEEESKPRFHPVLGFDIPKESA